MSWIQKLYETYEQCNGKEPPGSDPLMPIAHTTQQAHIEIVIDGKGNFRRASVLLKGHQTTLIPCTDDSGVRSGKKPPNHPLCDKLQYVAADFQVFGGEVTSGFSGNPTEPHSDYLKMLGEWSNFQETHPKIRAILSYVKKGNVVKDLIDQKLLAVENNPPTLLKDWLGKKEDAPEIFRSISNEQTPEDAFIRWRVESPDSLISGTWEDEELIKSWINYYATLQTSHGICMVTGKSSILPDKHPNKIRHAGDKAKLISSNDNNGFTFRGRFTDDMQAASVSFEVTQKAHNALRWLIGRKQSFRNGDQVFVSWTIAGHPIPDPWSNTLDLFGDEKGLETNNFINPEHDPGDVGQAFAKRLNRAMGGYRAKLDDIDDVMVMGLDSATPGRMAITFYREIKGSEFLDRIKAWHDHNVWPQNFGKNFKFLGTPSPRDVAEAAYGRRLDDKLRKSTIERLIPCIIDGLQLPRDLVESCVRRAFNRVGLENWEWEKCLGVACSLYKGFYNERDYQMTVEENRKTRDYLYGRLLAVAENIEGRALYVGGEKNRSTMAARLMQRFADRPYSTWRTIELALTPYKSRLRSSRGAFLWEMEKLIDELSCSFTNSGNESFTNDRPLSGEFLLGYHCQRRDLRPEKSDETEIVNAEENQTK